MLMHEKEYYDNIYEIICECIPPQARVTLFNAILLHRRELLEELGYQKEEEDD